jgi:putative endonuclease
MGLRSWIAARRRPKSLGERGEHAAARDLKRLGYHILARHLDLPLGELDIIAVDGRTVVFVEVNTSRILLHTLHRTNHGPDRTHPVF